MKRRVVSLLLASTMVMGLTVGCGSKDSGKSEEKGNVLKVAAIETAYGAGMWEEVAKAFEASHEGVTVELTTDKVIEDVISPDMKAGNYPDVVMCATGRDKAMPETFVKEQNLVDLTDVLALTVPGEEITVGEKIVEGFATNTTAQPYGDGKTYLMPMFYSPCGLFYNAGLFEEKGWEVPTTWDEMWELGETAKAEGIALFTYPTAGYFDAFLYSLMYEAFGEKFVDAISYGEGIWETEEAAKVFEILDKLADYTEATTPANANNDNFQKNQQLILDNKALFMPNGTWVVGEMAEAPRAEGFAWGMTALPAVEENGTRASFSWFEQVWMPAGAENQDLGKEFIAFLYSDEAAAIFAKSGAIQPIPGLTDSLEGDNKLFYSIYDNGAAGVLDGFKATKPVEGKTLADTFFNPINSLVTGDKTIEDWKAQIIEDNDIYREALIK